MQTSRWDLSSLLEFRHLQMLVALDEARSVSKVADRLHVSQPAVSKSLTTLESELNTQLFVRTIRGLEPTPQGEIIIRHARAILTDMDHAGSELKNISEGKIARFSMGVLPATAITLLPKFVERIESESIAVSISIEEGTMETLLPDLRSEQLDFIVGNLSPHLLGDDIGTCPLYLDPVVVAVRPGHPLLRKKSVSWKQLADYPLLLPLPGTQTRHAIDEALLQGQITIPRGHLESVSTMTNIGVLQQTDSVGFFSQELARYFSGLNLMTILPIALPNVGIRVGLAWLTRRQRGAALQNVCRIFRDIVDEHVQAPEKNLSANA